jgi:cytochrome P450/precorrin-6B methylase 2
MEETMTQPQMLTQTPAEKYETFFVPAIFGPWAKILVELAGIERGQGLLDLACGTGIVARTAAPILGPEGRIVALDLRPGMLAAARALPAPEGVPIEWVERDAQETGLPDASFDHIICQAGLQFFPDPGKALAEAWRMLKPGGRLTVLVWQDLEKQGLLHAMSGPEFAALKPLGVTWDDFNQAFAMGDPEELRALLNGAGFRQIETFQEDREVRFSDPDNFVFNMEYAYSAVVPEFAADPDAFARFVEAQLTWAVRLERDDFRGWSNTLLSAAPPEERTAAAVAMAEFLARLVADKGAHPGEDMLSAVVKASEDGDTLSAREATSMAFLLLVAGHETTVNLIGNGTLALLRHPDQLALLRADPGLVPNAVEEFLRYDGPVNLATFRYTTEPVSISGTTIPANEFVLLSLASANRDPEQFPEPDRLDIEREAGNLAFGHGIHHCLGAPLARLEGEIAFNALLARFPHLELARDPSELVWRTGAIIRGLTTLPIRFG